MQDVKVMSSNGWELVHSTTILLGSNKVTVTYDGLPMDVVFTQNGSGEVRYTGTAEGSKWILELFNFANPIGEGMFELVPFAEQEGRAVNISFFVQTLNAATNYRVLTLNFFKEPAKQ